MKYDRKLDRIRLKKEVINELKNNTSNSDAEIYKAIDHVILKESRTSYGSLEEKTSLRKQIFDSIRNLGILEKYIKDETITEIMVIGPRKIFVERCGRVENVEEYFDSEDEVMQIIDQILAPINRVVNESRPVVDGRLPDGSRVHVVVPPISLEGPTITIRKFQRGGMTMGKLLSYGEFPAALMPILEIFVKCRYNILISGATNSGKSSLINALSRYIGQDERIITIEDSAELQFFHVDNLVRLEARNPNAEGENEVTMNDLIKASLRMRPDRIIVGEVRGGEAVSMLQAFSTGHSGSLSSIHANSAKDALSRLETMVLMGIDLPLRAIKGQIASSINLIIHLNRFQDGRRYIEEIQELVGLEGDFYKFNTLFRYEEGILKVKGTLENQRNLDMYNQKNIYDRFVDSYADYEENPSMEPLIIESLPVEDRL